MRSVLPRNFCTSAHIGGQVLTLEGQTCSLRRAFTTPLGEQSWEQFSRNWNSDVKLSLLFCQAALNTPLPSGTTIILMSSGAAIGGSPLSGGYAGSQRPPMFLVSYAPYEADEPTLRVRFLA